MRLKSGYTGSMKYPAQAKKLIQLLETDQQEVRAAGRLYFHEGKAAHHTEHTELKRRVHARAMRMLEVLDDIGEPSISNIGSEAAKAVSILATHDGGNTLKIVLDSFNALYAQNKDEVYYQAIPAMTDWQLLQEHRPQRFGTQWLFDDDKKPWLPTVEDFNHVNERRGEYGIEPLRWPKSLAIPETEQPWLGQPLSDLVMRDMTDAEYTKLAPK